MPARMTIVEFDVAPGSYRAFDALLREHARITRETEPGCTAFDIVRVVDDAGTTDMSKLVLVEAYANEEAYVAHGKQPRMPAFRQSYANMVLGRRVIRGLID